MLGWFDLFFSVIDCNVKPDCNFHRYRENFQIWNITSDMKFPIMVSNSWYHSYCYIEIFLLTKNHVVGKLGPGRLPLVLTGINKPILLFTHASFLMFTFQIHFKNGKYECPNSTLWNGVSNVKLELLAVAF